MIKLAVVTALVAFLKVLAETYLPQFPISAELINTLILALLSLIGVEMVEFAGFRIAGKFFGGLKKRGLWK